MGMDVYGVNPTEEVGYYFRRNVWGWRPLWNYVEDLHPEIAQLVPHAHSNDGDGLSRWRSTQLADLLDEDIESGKAQEYIDTRDRVIAEIPMEPCEYCESTGIRKDSVGVEAGMPERELEKEFAKKLGRTHGTCNACHGLGECEPFQRWYFLDLDDIKEFSAFVRASGGFEIN